MSTFLRLSTRDGVTIYVRSTEVTQFYRGDGETIVEVRGDAQSYYTSTRPKKVARKIAEWEAEA